MRVKDLRRLLKAAGCPDPDQALVVFTNGLEDFGIKEVDTTADGPTHGGQSVQDWTIRITTTRRK